MLALGLKRVANFGLEVNKRTCLVGEAHKSTCLVLKRPIKGRVW